MSTTWIYFSSGTKPTSAAPVVVTCSRCGGTDLSPYHRCTPPPRHLRAVK